KLFGPYSRNDVEPFEQEHIVPSSDLPVLYGEADLPNGERTAFATYVRIEEKNTWVYAGCPLGSLGRAYPVGTFPWDLPATAPWVAEVSAWLFELAEHVYQRVRFSNGVIDWLTIADVDEFENTIVPERRYYGYVAVLAGQLLY